LGVSPNGRFAISKPTSAASIFNDRFGSIPALELTDFDPVELLDEC
jgi:hypothetical protein